MVKTPVDLSHLSFNWLGWAQTKVSIQHLLQQTSIFLLYIVGSNFEHAETRYKQAAFAVADRYSVCEPIEGGGGGGGLYLVESF